MNEIKFEKYNTDSNIFDYKKKLNGYHVIFENNEYSCFYESDYVLEMKKKILLASIDTGIRPKVTLNLNNKNLYIGVGESFFIYKFNDGGIYSKIQREVFYDYLILDDKNIIILIFELSIVVCDLHLHILSEDFFEIVSDWELMNDKFKVTDTTGKTKKISIF